MIRRRLFTAGAAAAFGGTVDFARRGRGAIEVHSAVGSDDPRSDHQHGLHRAQSRLHGVRHAVRHGQQVRRSSRRCWRASPSRTTASAGS